MTAPTEGSSLRFWLDSGRFSAHLIDGESELFGIDSEDERGFAVAVAVVSRLGDAIAAGAIVGPADLEVIEPLDRRHLVVAVRECCEPGRLTHQLTSQAFAAAEVVCWGDESFEACRAAIGELLERANALLPSFHAMREATPRGSRDGAEPISGDGAIRFWVNRLGEYGRSFPDREQLLSAETQPAGGEPSEDDLIAMRRQLTPAELDLFVAWSALQIDNGRWRSSASIDYTAQRTSHLLCTEFAAETGDSGFWRELERVVAAHDGRIEVMRKDEDIREEGTEDRQVAVSFDLRGAELSRREAIIAAFEADTQPLWERSGVCVI